MSWNSLVLPVTLLEPGLTWPGLVGAPECEVLEPSAPYSFCSSEAWPGELQDINTDQTSQAFTDLDLHHVLELVHLEQVLTDTVVRKWWKV